MDINVYCAGGTAINIISPLLGAAAEKDPGYAKLNMVFIDTSLSNLPKRSKIENFHHVTGLSDVETDGSGLQRSRNLKAVQQAAPEILHKNPPASLNVILCGGGGGSGSVIANVLASEIMAEGHSVVVIMVGATNCTKSIKNTIDTIQSFSGIAQVKKRSLPIYYLQNKVGAALDHEVDLKARAMILLLAVLWSGENHGLDTADLVNFMTPEKVTQFAPGIVGLATTTTGILTQERGQAFSTLASLLYDTEEDASINQIVPYSVFGILPTHAAEKVKVDTPVHVVTIQGYFQQVLDTLEKLHTTSTEFYRLNPIGNEIHNASATSDGLVVSD